MKSGGFDHKAFDRSILTLSQSARIRSQYSVRQANRILAARVWKECPVDTGKLRETIRIEPMRQGPFGVSQEVSVGRTDPRKIVGFVHDGTKNQSPNPFFDRAVDATESQRRSAIVGIMGQIARIRTV